MSAAPVVDAAPRFIAARVAASLDGLARCTCELAEIEARLAELRATVERVEREAARPALRVVKGSAP